MIDFTSRQLRAFLLVAQHRSFSKAAGALFVTPSGLSILVREFEAQLGTRLFDRTTRRVELTRSGEELLTAARNNLQELDRAMLHIRRPEGTTPLSIGALPLMATTVLVPAIREFQAHRPDFQFRLFDTDSATAMQKVESGELDMAVGVFFKYLPGIRRTLLFRFPLVVIRGNMAQTSRRATTSWSALKGEKLISLTPSSPFQHFIDQHLARAGVKYQPSLVVNYLNTQIALVEAGEGVAIVPSYGILACRDQRTATSRLVNPAVQVDFHEIRHGGRKLPSIGNDFTSFLRSHVAIWAERSGFV
jgi:LysR family transcriptional regulator, carnitine catabolism transcriptional activator